MDVYLRVKFEVYSIILTSFRQGVILPHPPPPPETWKQTPKKPTQIRVKVRKCTVKCILIEKIHTHSSLLLNFKCFYCFWCLESTREYQISNSTATRIAKSFSPHETCVEQIRKRSSAKSSGTSKPKSHP